MCDVNSNRQVCREQDKKPESQGRFEESNTVIFCQ